MLTPLSAFSSLRAYAIQRRPAAAVFTLPLILLASAAAGLTPAAALATDGPASSTLSVVGTSDVSDSGLFANLIKPMFQQAYPQYTITYKGEGTSKAIADAKTGNYSALLVHAASVENQFVSSGYSAEPYGRAVFYGDFVMLGPTGTTDPAGVLANAPHDMVKAFQDIATAGETSTPTADFVSRADGSGTNIEEHLIWAMTTGVPLCTVPSANGGGDEPAGSSDSGQTCPEYTGTASSIVLPNYPDWYHAGASTQSANISVANTCSPSVGHGSSNDCYVFTDRGTYDC
jgi:tungstate transport system substrate-binding protein